MKKPIQVTRSASPNFIRYLMYSTQMFRSRSFTNGGRFESKLEKSLSDRFDIPNVVLMSNGTMPILFLLSQLPRNSTVLTTPFSFVATTSSIFFSNLRVRYVDIDESTLLPSLKSVSDAVNANSIDAILLTQVYGKFDGLHEIQEFAKEKNIPLYIDASHSFDVFDDSGNSVFKMGDASTTSFHATKLLSTAEGGALFTSSDRVAQEARRWKTFGYESGQIVSVGINAKMSELSAIFGLASIDRVTNEILRRKKIANHYRNGILRDDLIFVNSPNCSYLPVIFPTREETNEVIANLNSKGIFPRRYFYPSLDLASAELGLSNDVCPVSRSVSERILCLPIGDDVKKKVRKTICELISNGR